MKIPQTLLAAAFVLASSVAVTAQTSARSWLENYYQHPQPDRFTDAMRELSHENYFGKPGHIDLGIGFVSFVFAQNPDRVDGWLADLSDFPLTERRLAACALWQAGDPRATALLQRLGMDADRPRDVAQLAAHRSTPVIDLPVRSAATMNLAWGSYLASGNADYIRNVLRAIGRDEPGLDERARYAFAMDAATHPTVLAICEAELARQPEGERSRLRAVLNEAAAAANRPRT